MPKCCGSLSCGCVLSEGVGITITGSGSVNDPFVITADQFFVGQDNVTFDLTVSGAGTALDPWVLQVNYATTAKLNQIPDVNAPAPTNGQVLGWDNPSQKWTPRAPTTAAAGSVTHDTSLAGDGSVGTPLAVLPSPGGYLEVVSTGLKVTDNGIQQWPRHFIDEADRSAAVPAPAVNTLSLLANHPGQVYYWNGLAWLPITPSFDTNIIGGSFLEISGAYNASRLTKFIKKFSAVTDALGNFDVLTPADLGVASGVVDILIQETGAPVYRSVPFPNTDRVSAAAYLLTDGSVLANTTVTGMCEAWVY